MVRYVGSIKLTLYNEILRIARNFLETRENVKISTHPVYRMNLDWFSWEWSKINLFFQEKKFNMANFSKWPFFKINNSQKFFVKISWIGPWVSRIDWCEGHWNVSTYMVMRLSDISCVYVFFVFLGCFWPYVGQPHDHISWDISMPFASINPTNPRTKP